MHEARAVEALLLPPEWRPDDPFPPHAPDEPEWVFETYEDYWWWLEAYSPELRLVIIDPQNGQSYLRYIARPPIDLSELVVGQPEWNGRFYGSTMIPLSSGIVFVGVVPGSPSREKIMVYCKYATTVDVSSPEVLDTVAENDYWHSWVVATNGKSVAICRVGSVYSGPGGSGTNSGIIHIFTPEPEPGKAALIKIEAPFFVGGTFGSSYLFMAAELEQEQLTLLCTEYGF